MNSHQFLVPLVMLSVLVSSCAAPPPVPTNTPTLPPPTHTPTIMPTSTPSPTLTPLPTPTVFGGGSLGKIVFGDSYSCDQIILMNANGSNPTTVDYYGCDPIWSPDGTKIAYRLEAGVTGKSEIYVLNTDSDNQTTIVGGLGIFGISVSGNQGDRKSVV